MKKKRVGVIGNGSIGKRHVANLISLGHSVLTYDPIQAISWPEIPMASLADIKQCDAIVIASPTPNHLDHFIEFKGRPIFMEKPIADKEASIVSPDMIAMVGYNLRFHSCVLKAKEWIDADFLGYPIWANLVCAQFNDKPDYLRDGVILNWSHEIDLALYLIGPATVGACVSNKKESLADISLIHANGCYSTIHLDYETKPEVRQTIIVGTEATIIIDIVNRRAWLRSVGGAVLDSFVGIDTFDENYLDEMETFIARIDGKETIGCSGNEGLEVLKVCLDAKRLAKGQ